MGLLDDHVALITGAGSGIGVAIAKRFVREGAKVVAFDRSQDRLAALEAELGGQAVSVCGDVRSSEDNERAVGVAVEKWGVLHTFVGNAGIWDSNRPLRELSATDVDLAFRDIFEINVKGYIVGAMAALPEIAKAKGSMVFTLSTSSFYVGGGGVIYVASKHACLGLVRQMAYEFAPDVRVNAVAPGGTPTNLRADAVFSLPEGNATGGRQDTGNALNIALESDDHAGAYAFLASPDARAMTGVVLNTDGGRGVMRAAREVPAP